MTQTQFIQAHVKKLDSLILLKHTLFTLLWLISLALLGMSNNCLHATLQTWLYLALAYFSARTSGMCFNRLIDKDIDAKNPRTANRALPQKQVTAPFTLFQAIFFLSVMLFSAFQLGSVVFVASALLGFLLVVYSFTKRYTALCHFVLGAIYLVGMICFWAAVAQSHFQIPVFLGLSLAFSIAASDIFYGMLDIHFDRAHGIKSIPALVGIERAGNIAKLLQGLSVIFLILLSRFFSIIMFVSSLAVGSVYLLSYYKRDFEERFRFVNTYSGFVFLLCSILEFVWHEL